MELGARPIVETRAGKVRGVVRCSILGDHYQAFKGIPYAGAPVGQLRFRDPIAADPWNDIRDASSHGPICAQCDFVTKVIDGSEDCLYLNVYTRNSKPEAKRHPVMVWIHGGCFVVGDGNEERYGPDYFVSKDVVLVTVNYRLGVLGFLNLDDEVSPGNQGLKDQVLALKWVRDNAACFGGDPDNITIFGESAGSASVHYLTLSPLAKGLFHKAICQSGVVLNPWTRASSKPKPFGYMMCERLGEDCGGNPKRAVNFLRSVEVRKLIEIQNQLLTDEERVKFMFPFGPGVDDKSAVPFMPTDPEKAAEVGIQVPLLIGYNSREGILFMEFARGLIDDLLPSSRSEFQKFLNPNTEELFNGYGMLPDEIRRLYFGLHEDVTKDKIDNLIDFMGDAHFVEGIHRVARIQVARSCASTYLYKYSYDSEASPFKTLLEAAHLKGACHADELRHQFRSELIERAYEPLRRGTPGHKIMERMIELWVNFASTGRPTPTTSELVPFYWQPVASGSVLRYLNIDEDLRMETTLNLELRFNARKFSE